MLKWERTQTQNHKDTAMRYSFHHKANWHNVLLYEDSYIGPDSKKLLETGTLLQSLAICKSIEDQQASFAIKMNISFIQGLFLTPLIRAHCLVRRITSLLSSLVKS